MASYNRAPDPINSTFFIPGSNTPGNGVKVFTYSNLSSTKVTVYKDTSGTPHTNPILLDSGGNLPGGSQVYIAAGNTLTVKYAPATDSDPPLSPYLTINDVVGINDVSTAVSEWTLGPTPTFVSATVFTLAGDQTANFEKGRFVKSTNTGGTVYSKIINSIFGVLTTVTVVNINGSIDSGLSAVSYGADAVNPAFGADHVNRKATAVASSGNGTTDIWGTNGDLVHVTGTNTILSFSSSAYAGLERTLIFDGILSINSSASIGIPGGNVTTAANDRAVVRAESVSTAIIVNYSRTALQSVFAPQASNAVYIGPSTGSSSLPTFRSLVGAEAASVLISAKSVVNTSFVAFGTSEISDWSIYDKYQFELIRLNPSAAGAFLQVQLSSTGTLNYASTGSYDVGLRMFSQAGVTSQVVGTFGNFLLTDTTTAQTTSPFYGLDGQFNLFHPSVAGMNKQCTLSDLNYISAGTGGVIKGDGGYKFNGDQNPVNGIRFLYNTGNVSTGAIYMYGLRKS